MTHFRILYRQFLLRLLDIDLLSGSARGDTSVLAGQLVSLLVSTSILTGFLAIPIGNAIRRGGQPGPLWSAEHFLLSLTMLAVGLFALITWDSTLPGRQDALVLGPLPVRPAVIFAAKLASNAAGMAIVIAALNCVSAVLWPLILTPNGSGTWAEAQFVGAFWIAHFAAGAFVYCSVLCLQAAAAQLPRRWNLRVSPGLQAGAFVLFLGVFCLRPSFAANYWHPADWFTACVGEWSGVFAADAHAVMPPLERRGLVGLAVSAAAAVIGFALSYAAMLRKVVEEPDSAPRRTGGIRLPSFGSRPQTALAHFIIRTVQRSGRHRVLVAFYLGGGIALVVLYVAIVMDVMKLTGVDLLHRVSAPLPAASLVLMGAAWLGVRTVFAVPVDLRANWIFRVVPTPRADVCLAAISRALGALSVVPVAVLAAAALWVLWPWTAAFLHAAALLLTGAVAVQLSLLGFRKIPFTCSYLPGKSRIHLLFWLGVIPFFFLVHKLVDWELQAMNSPIAFGAALTVLGGIALATRRAATKSILRDGPEMEFEEVAAEDLLELRLND